MLTPIQTWFALQTEAPIPGADEARSQFESAVLHKLSAVRHMGGLGGSIARKHEINRIIGYAMYYARREGIEHFPEIVSWCQVEYSGTSPVPPPTWATEVHGPPWLLSAVKQSILTGEPQVVPDLQVEWFSHAVLRGHQAIGFDAFSNPLWMLQVEQA